MKVGGEVAYNYEKPADSCDPSHYVTFTVDIEAALNEQTSAKIELRNMAMWSEWDAGNLKIGSAQLRTKLAGLGTLSAGINPDYGTSPFERLNPLYYEGEDVRMNGIWGLTQSTPAVTFATEKVGGFAGQVYANLYDPDQQDDYRQVAAELTYDLPVVEGSSVGVAINKWSDEDDMDWSVIGKIPVGETALLYGEVGKMGWSDDLNIKAFGAKAKLGAADLCAEAHLGDSDSAFMLKASCPFQGIDLSATYLTGDAWPSSHLDGLLMLGAAVRF